MLPDFPQLKADLAASLLEFLRARVDYHLGPLREIRQFHVFEGSGQTMLRASGESEEIDMKEFSAQFAIKYAELPSLSLDALLQKLDATAEEMAKQMAQHTYESISRAVQAIGNVVDAKGKALTAETLLEALSSIHIEFGPDGRPRMPQLHIHPNLLKAVRLATEKFDSSPDLQLRFKDIIQRKHEEWRAREASRKLVG